MKKCNKDKFNTFISFFLKLVLNTKNKNVLKNNQIKNKY